MVMSHFSLLAYITLFYMVSALSFEKSSTDNKIYLIVEEVLFPIITAENALTQKLISIIQNEQTSIRMSFRAKIEPGLLDVISNDPIEGKKGDLLLYNGKEIILLKEDTTFTTFMDGDSGEYVKIGKCSDTEEFLNRIETNKTVFLWNSFNYENQKGKVKPYGKYFSIMNFFTWKIFTFFCFILI